MFHTGTSLGEGDRNKYGDPILLDDVIKDNNLTVVIAHAGRPLWWDLAFFLARSYPDIYLELSWFLPESLKSYISRLDQVLEKSIYGSDFPSYKEQRLTGHPSRSCNE
ncbi:hypothetical protein HS1genome_1408 [Sulfodiicoccus acidiphilus]|uniref:Amidohydrolase-related domain-containing protein n=1 Tax=Sulfodiicoccus acidiphilus TaxID=1670455 RepID=A0A348B4B7_9CREN|nr:amidohydrolase family protein [Sulfodiicoccus acidiphilus]BBD73019.1 hypothetical protein HS1genome_1408 [Sulfodiicoccus acidiphilus]GGU04490.1 hypothetical protein GCM10007116_21350 [Sulfodiicoccus acidiphilus]